MLHKHGRYTHTYFQAYYACYAYAVTPRCLPAQIETLTGCDDECDKENESQQKQKHLCCQNDVVAHFFHLYFIECFLQSRFQRVLYTTIIGTSTNCTKVPTFDSFTLLFMHRSPRAPF